MAVAYILIGFAAGLGLFALMLRIATVYLWAGDLRIDRSDDRPYLFLEMSKNVEWLVKQKIVVLKVNPNSYITRN